MKVPELKIGSLVARIPIIQGGMGVRVSLASLASAVANQGGIGTISCIGLGDHSALAEQFVKSSSEELIHEIRKARSLTDGVLAVNVMGVLSNSKDLIKTSIQEGIKLIVYGAGLPTHLPEIADDPSVNLVPIVSSSRVAEFIMRTWDRLYERIPDGFILEGPLAGGHLGFTNEQLDHKEDFALELLLPQLLETVKPYEEKYGRKIPIIAAGGVYTGYDIVKMLSLGASGVQMGTRFVCTDECGVSQPFKQAYIDAKEEDITIIKSPVGMPGRAIFNRFLQDLDNGEEQKINCPYKCLTACKVKTAKYCIAQALFNSFFGDVDHGLIFCGQNAHRIDKIVSVNDLIKELISEIENFKEVSLVNNVKSNLLEFRT